MPHARRSWMRRAAVLIIAVLIAGLCAVVAKAQDSSAVLPGPHNQAKALADGTAAGAEQPNIPVATAASTAAGATPHLSTTAAAAGAGARIGGFVSFHVYATQYAAHDSSSVEVAVP